MEIDISGRHFHVTEALKDYVAEKIQKLDRYSLKIETVHVVLEVQKFHQVAEITVAGNHLRLTAKEESADMYAACDKSLGNIQLQLGRQHDRIKAHKGNPYKEGEPPPQDEA
ncbi:MAG: ribosomal subunit interface protein [Candidatus Omnitrophica bacterium CG1_02_49_16]|nr:MAG: ribosomal subunit interface protein [Candidatus Omnitrophica bacterium CG1_02_49_16]